MNNKTNNNKYKILVVEDDFNISSFMEAILQAHQYAVIRAENCAQALTLFSSHNPDLVLLDLGLPDQDGLSLISKLRPAHSTPILVVSARSDEWDKVAALDAGANDYITKPFGTAELLARVRAALRSRYQNAADSSGAERGFCLHDLKIDYDSRLVTVSSQEIHLTQTEYNLLALLAQHAGKMLTYSAIIQHIWGAGDPGEVKKLQVNMANLRRKLGIRPGDTRYIVNELGVGYRLQNE